MNTRAISRILWAARRIVARALAGTALAVVSGWAAAVVFVALEGFVTFPAAHRNEDTVVAALWKTPIAFGIFIWFFILPVWVLVLVPLYLLVPSTSVLWRRSVCTALGALAASAIMLALHVFGWFDRDELWFFCATAAIVGAATCFVGSVTRDRFKPAI